MSDVTKHQTCPYCGYEEDDSQAEWEEGRHSVECYSCKKYYSVAPIYKFLGFESEKNCEGCGEPDDNCECEIEDNETTEPHSAAEAV